MKTVKLHRIGVPDRDGFVLTEEALGKLPDSLPVTIMFNPRFPPVGVATNFRIEDGWLVADVEVEREDFFTDGTEYAIAFECLSDRIVLPEVGQVPQGTAIQ